MDVRPFRAEDMLWIIKSGTKEEGMKYFGSETLEELAQQTEKDGLSMTGTVNGVIVVCGGIRKLWANTGEVWALLSPKTNLYPKRTYICIKKGLERLIAENNFVRLQGWCRVDFPKAHTLFRHLNFKVEGRARRYTPDGCDCLLYALIKDNVRK